MRHQEAPPFTWAEYLSKTNAQIAPQEAFSHNVEVCENDFLPGHRLEVYSPDFEGAVHVATVINCFGPRIQLRFEGCDSSNDIFENVDSDRITPIDKNRKFWRPPLRYLKDVSKYVSNCDRILQKLDEKFIAPPSAFKQSPKLAAKNLFEVGQKLEAVDLKRPWNICPATIKRKDSDNVEIHLDGWASDDDYVCSFKSRTLFPVGWCERVNHSLQAPGPRVELPSPSPPTASPQSNDSLKSSTRQTYQYLATKSSPPAKSETLNGSPKISVKTEQDSKHSDEHLKRANNNNNKSPQTSPRNRKSTNNSNNNVSQKLNSNNKRPLTDTPKTAEKKKKTPLLSHNPINGDIKKNDVLLLLPLSSPPTKETSLTEIVSKHDEHQQQSKQLSATTIEAWNCGDVNKFVAGNELLKKYLHSFKQHKIDGKALLLLSVKTMVSEMGISLGRALKSRKYIEEIISNSK